MTLLKTCSFTPNMKRLVDLLSEMDGVNKSQTVRDAVKHTAIAKANEIVAKFVENISHASDTSWHTIRNQAGELVRKRASLRHPQLSPAQAMAKATVQPDAMGKTLYSVQAIKSQEHFVSFTSVLRSGTQ